MVQCSCDRFEERTPVLPAILISEAVSGRYQRGILPGVVMGHKAAVFSRDHFSGSYRYRCWLLPVSFCCSRPASLRVLHPQRVTASSRSTRQLWRCGGRGAVRTAVTDRHSVGAWPYQRSGRATATMLHLTQADDKY